MKLALIIIALISITSVIIGWLMSRRKVALPARLEILSLVFLVAGLSLTIIFSVKLSDNFKKRTDYQKTGGIIVAVDIVGEKAFRPEIIYQYNLEDEIYQDTSNLNPPMFGGKRKKYDVAKALMEPYLVGDSINVIYNPDDFSESYLKIPLKWNLFGAVGFGVTLYMLGLIGLIIRKKE